MTQSFVVAIDGSEHGSKALDLAINLAKASSAELTVLHVVPYEPMPEGLQQYAALEGIPAEEMNARFHHGKALGDRITGEAEERAHMAGLSGIKTEVVEGHPANEIVAVATALDAEMLFIGSRGLSDVGGILLGSVSHKVMHLAPCTCVAVK